MEVQARARTSLFAVRLHRQDCSEAVHPPGPSHSRPGALLAFGRLCCLIRRCQRPQQAALARLSRPKDQTLHGNHPIGTCRNPDCM